MLRRILEEVACTVALGLLLLSPFIAHNCF